jgi:hypothetical protein
MGKKLRADSKNTKKKAFLWLFFLGFLGAFAVLKKMSAQIYQIPLHAIR